MANTITGAIPWMHRPWFYSPKAGEIPSADNIRKQYTSINPGFIQKATPAMGISLLVTLAGGVLWQAGKEWLGNVGKWAALSVAFGGVFALLLSKWLGVNLNSKSHALGNAKFQLATPMLYANKDQTKREFDVLAQKLKPYLKTLSKDPKLYFQPGKTIYIPDTHGDFVHLIQILHKHDLLDEELNLKQGHPYVFLGDFYDRGKNSHITDYWLNHQIQNNAVIYRLAGNHEAMFLIRNKTGNSPFDPANDVEKDIENNFEVTEELLKNIAKGNILATYAEPTTKAGTLDTIYAHSFVNNKDVELLGADNIEDFAVMLNERFKECGKAAYKIFLEAKKTGNYEWKKIISPFKTHPLFSHKGGKGKTFIWRRPPISPQDSDKYLPKVKNIPDNVLQIVGHTPVFYFDHPNLDESKPFLVKSSNGTGQVLFSDIGISYYYDDNDLERPDAVINRELAQTKN